MKGRFWLIMITLLLLTIVMAEGYYVVWMKPLYEFVAFLRGFVA